jgi:adenylate kinase
MGQLPRIVLLGKQGAGKGTQAERLADHYGIVHLSTGDLFRAQADAGTAFGLEAKRYMDEGELVPDDIVIGVVEECLAPGGPLSDGFILDGFPRNKKQAVELERVLGTEHPIDIVVHLDVPKAIVLDRIAGRRVCKNGHTYHWPNMPPKVLWACDICGEEVFQRSDDTEEAVTKRLATYEKETRPIRDFYKKSGHQVITVNGVGEGEVVFDRLVLAIDDATAPVET